MALGADLTRRLIGAIEGNTLVFLCGAGLSIPPPSSLLSAAEVSRRCYDRWRHMEDLDPAYQSDIDRLAGHFHARREFESVFIRILVPWDELVGCPNDGHAAIADLLITRSAHAALSANIDHLIEQWASNHKVLLKGALTGQEASDPAYTTSANALIKFHGCINKPEKTLWTRRQLSDTDIQMSINSCLDWMNLNLPRKDLVVVGFWTDWDHFNDVLEAAFTISNANSVTVIDPSPTATLQSKAPTLWAKLNGLSRVFEHVQASGDVALKELRTAYSKVWARKYYDYGIRWMEADGGDVTVAAPFDALDGEDLYDLRRDAEGLPYNHAAKLKSPNEDAAEAAHFYIALLNAGATQRGAWLQLGGRSIRVINGAGKPLTVVQAKYKEPPTIPQPDIVVCAGAVELGVPARLIDHGRGASTVRPASGGGARWWTREKALEELIP